MERFLQNRGKDYKIFINFYLDTAFGSYCLIL